MTTAPQKAEAAPRHESVPAGRLSARPGAAGVGLPAPLLSGIAALSGLDLSDVRVHRASDAPARLGALAYAQGADIHLGPGQSQHLPHEAWHIVQQRQGRVTPTWQAKGLALNDDPALEHEADRMGAAALAHGAAGAATPGAAPARGLPAVYGLPPGLGRGQRAALPVAQCLYANLDALGQARVDARSARTYAEKAGEFEERLGARLSEAAEPMVAVNAMLDKVKQVVNAWADHTGQARLQVYGQEFKFDDGDKYFGAFMMSGAAIKKVFDSRDTFGKAQPARKKLKVVYNAVRNNNLAKWLKVASDELAEHQAALLAARVQAPVTVVRTLGAFNAPNSLVGAQVENVTPGFAAQSGLAVALANSGRHADVQQSSLQDKVPVAVGGGPARPVHISAPDKFSAISRGTPAEVAQVDIANRDRLYHQNQGVDYAHQNTVRNRDLPNLTADEIRLLRQRQLQVDPGPINKTAKRAFKARADDKLSWEQGRDAIAVLLNSPVDQAAAAIGARLEAGVSGSTGMMFAAAKNLGLNSPLMLQRLRLAMLGWMLPNHDHSFYEIMRAAEIQGVPFTTDPLRPGWQYEAPQNYLPVAVAALRDLLPERQFPRWFLGGAHKDALGDRLTAQSPAGLNAVLRLRGLPDAAVNALDDRAKSEALLMAEDIRSANFQPTGVGGPPQQAAALAANRLLARQLRERSSYRWLSARHPTHAELWFTLLMARAQKPLSDDMAALRRADPATLPALAANAAAHRLWLVGAGVPAPLLVPVADHFLADLVLLGAMVAHAPFTAAQPINAPANLPHLQALQAAPAWARLAGLGRQINLNAIAGRLIGQAHGGVLEGGLHDQSLNPRTAGLIARGVPDSLARSVGGRPDSNAVFDFIDHISAEVTRIMLLAAPLRLAELQLFITGALAWQQWFTGQFGANRFDLVVAAMADRAGMDLSASPHLKALASAAAAQSLSLAIPPASFGQAGFQAAGLTMAEDTLKANLGNVATLVGTPWHNLLAPVELASINAYSKLGGMGAWQAALSGLDTTNRVASDKLVKLAPRIAAAVSGLRKLPVAAGPVYSGARQDLAGQPAQAIAQFPVGRIWTQDNFLSTAKTVASSFIPNLSYGVAYEITRLRTGRDIQMISTNSGEEEVLFPPGARFIVVEVTDRSAMPGGYGKVWVRMVEL